MKESTRTNTTTNQTVECSRPETENREPPDATRQGRAVLRRGRPALLISSTSWTSIFNSLILTDYSLVYLWIYKIYFINFLFEGLHFHHPQIFFSFYLQKTKTFPFFSKDFNVCYLEHFFIKNPHTIVACSPISRPTVINQILYINY